MLYWNTPSSSISNLVLYPRSAFCGTIIFVIGSIRFNRESMDSRFLHNGPANRLQTCGGPRNITESLQVLQVNIWNWPRGKWREDDGGIWSLIKPLPPRWPIRKRAGIHKIRRSYYFQQHDFSKDITLMEPTSTFNDDIREWRQQAIELKTCSTFKVFSHQSHREQHRLVATAGKWGYTTGGKTSTVPPPPHHHHESIMRQYSHCKKFHKECKTSSVRRRNWHRPIQSWPVPTLQWWLNWRNSLQTWARYRPI